MKYFALSSLLMAFCMQAGDNSKKMAPGAFNFSDSHAQNLPRKVPITIISHHLTADYPALHKPKSVNLKSRKSQRKKDSQYTMRPSRHNGNNSTRLIFGLVSPVGEEIAFAPGQGVIGVFTLLSKKQ